MKKICLTILFLSLSGCAFIPDFYSNISRERNTFKSMKTYTISPYIETVHLGERKVYYKNYELNQRYYASTGEPVIRVQTYTLDETERNQVSLNEDVTVKVGIEEFTIPKKTYSIKGVVNIDGKEYYVLDGHKKYFALLDKNFRLQNRMLYENGGWFETKYILLNERLFFLPAAPVFKQKVDVSSTKRLVDDYEIVYDGIKEDQLAFFYKKSVLGTDGYAGSYDTLFYPKESTMINLAGVMMQIIRADKDRIEYRFLKEYK